MTLLTKGMASLGDKRLCAGFVSQTNLPSSCGLRVNAGLVLGHVAKCEHSRIAGTSHSNMYETAQRMKVHWQQRVERLVDGKTSCMGIIRS